MKTLSSLKVLVVEDEALVSMLVEDMLTDLGCAIVGPAAEIEEALRLAGSADIDAALLDVNLGGRPIFPVADALKARGVPFAFASGYGEAGLSDDHRGAAVLQKPFREADLRRVLEGLVGETA
ncbi:MULTISPECIES: response regulator [Caulobacter]|jgi:CheY-like chemotaxis protein|uniref:Response regulator receiver protein n=1 Tax=Caulobacter vibrioides OR37 TaxID=1292034 RepID=R0CX63_CAUVI|nr:MULTISPECIES: response regulator [Caulobacter]ENZ80920.1 response regulator receiver protein [Caulobacter vibrioides OR37]MBQ1560164.1 response regulator [Caulobacter sp.]